MDLRRRASATALICIAAAVSGCRFDEPHRGAANAAGNPHRALPAYPADPAEPGRLVVRSHALNPYNRYLDGQWQCSIVSSDGMCYFASSTHSLTTGSAFFRYDPVKRELICLSKDMQDAAGDLGAPREKLHTDIDEANGWLYFASRYGTGGADDESGGGQAIGYELATGRLRNFGVVHPGHGVYAGIAADAKRDRIWVITDSRQSELYRIDVKTGVKEHVGSVSPGGACFYMIVDAAGDCWFTVRGSPGALFRADAGDGGIERFERTLPGRAVWWTWAQPLDDSGRSVVLVEEGPHASSPTSFHIFDPAKIRSGGGFTLLKRVGLCGLGNAVAGNRLYFVQRPGGIAWTSGSGGDRDLRLHSLALDAPGEPELVNHGIIVDQDGRYPERVHALAADQEGRVYITADWELLPGELGSQNSTQRVGQGVLNRGQFFAVADPAAALPVPLESPRTERRRAGRGAPDAASPAAPSGRRAGPGPQTGPSARE